MPTEGGHRGFAPRTEQQDRLLRRLRREHGRVSTERVLSGPGLVALHAFLVEDEGLPRSPEVDAAPPAGRAPVISRRGLTGDDPACAAALALFVDIYGAEAGDLALSVVAAGGVWVAGGIAPDLLVVPAHAAAFRRAFEDKGRFAAFLREVPVRVVTSPDLGLLGAALESWPPTA